MITARVAAAPEYYLIPDCPMEGEGIEARWSGKDGNRLGLTGKPFGPLSFLRLAKGLNPETGGKLTARMKENRRDAIDLTVTVPKEISVLIEVAKDERVKAALWDANDYAMRLWESKVGVRVRKGGVSEDRHTGTMVWASFYHGTGRPVDLKDGTKPMPDPQAHLHNYCPNVSFDRKEGIWKALKRHHFDLTDISHKMNQRLAGSLRKLGYQASVQPHYETRRRKVMGFFIPKRVLVSSTLSVKGIDPQTVDLFCRRQDEIKAAEKRREASGQEMNGKYRAKASQIIRLPKGAAGPLTRQQVHRDWVSRVTRKQFNDLAAVPGRAKSTIIRQRWRESMQRHLNSLTRWGIQREGQTVEREKGRSR